MDGSTTLPTGPIAWAGKGTAAMSMVAGTEFGGAGNVTIQAAGLTSTAIFDSRGTVEIGSTAGTEVSLGDNTNEPQINIGDHTSSAFQTIDIGHVNTTGTTNLIIAANTEFQGNGASGGTNLWSTNNSVILPVTQTIVCGTGGTFGLPLPAYGVLVTSGTLSSNCVISLGSNSGLFLFDITGVTLGGTFGLVFSGGTAPNSVTLTTANVPTGVGLVQVWNRNTSTLAVLF